MTEKKPDIVVQDLHIRPIRRSSQDIQNWRSAINSFENKYNPSRVKLYDLYSDIKLDGHLEGVWGKRQDAITTRELVFTNKDGQVDNDSDINKILRSPDMRSIIKALHASIAWGFSLVQINNIYYDEDEEIYKIEHDLIPRKHVHPERNFECISKEQHSATKDILFKEPPESRYMIWAGDPIDMGLFIKAAQYVIYKRGNFGDWAQFSELFGMPFREARYDNYDDKTRQELVKAMEEYGGAGYAILPKNAEFTLHKGADGTGSDLFDKFKNACNAEISKAILGNTLTTEQGDNGARSLGEVHQGVEDLKHLSDLKFVNDIIDSKFKAILKRFGFDVTGGNIKFKSPPVDWEKLKNKWDVVSGIRRETPVDDNYIYEEFGIPKPENYDQLKEEMKQQNATSSQNLNLSIPAAQSNIIDRIKDFFV